MAEVFVFGSNLRGLHGAGSALEAWRFHGARLGIGIGRSGNSYAIPTKDENLKTLPLEYIRKEVEAFIGHAITCHQETFRVVKIGCGYARYTEDQIKPMFKDAPSNVILPEGWRA